MIAPTYEELDAFLRLHLRVRDAETKYYNSGNIIARSEWITVQAKLKHMANDLEARIEKDGRRTA